MPLVSSICSLRIDSLALHVVNGAEDRVGTARRVLGLARRSGVSSIPAIGESYSSIRRTYFLSADVDDLHAALLLQVPFRLHLSTVTEVEPILLKTAEP